MRTHLLTFTARNGTQETEEFEFRNDEEAAICARALLSEKIVAIAVRRLDPPGQIARVGLWVWRRGAPEWKAGE